MPAPAPIAPDLVRALFNYDPTTGQLVPKPAADRAARRTAADQWEVGRHRYALHRLIWAWHHPEAPNPYCVQFIDGNRRNTRIENLYAVPTNPRWAERPKQFRATLHEDGSITA